MAMEDFVFAARDLMYEIRFTTYETGVTGFIFQNGKRDARFSPVSVDSSLEPDLAIYRGRKPKQLIVDALQTRVRESVKCVNTECLDTLSLRPTEDGSCPECLNDDVTPKIDVCPEPLKYS